MYTDIPLMPLGLNLDKYIKLIAFEYTYIYIHRVYICSIRGCVTAWVHANIKLIAFELVGEDRERRENPVVSRLKIAIFALHKRG